MYGQSVTFTASVTDAGSGAGFPTGGVQFSVDGTLWGSLVSLDSNGATSMGISILAVGMHTISASYIPTGTFFGGFGSTTLTVDGITTATTVSSSVYPSVYGQSVTLNATVAPSSGSGAPTGNATFYDGSSVLGTVTLRARRRPSRSHRSPLARSRSQWFTAGTAIILPAPPRSSRRS